MLALTCSAAAAASAVVGFVMLGEGKRGVELAVIRAAFGAIVPQRRAVFCERNAK